MNSYYEEHKDEYFNYNGVQYYTGTKFTMKTEPYGEIVEAVFEGKGKDSLLVSYYARNPSYNMCNYTILVKEDWLADHIVELLEGNYYVELESRKRYIKDKDIPELFCGWILYLIIMVVLFIFKDRWLGWTAATVYFFYWRHKIKKENYYYEDE